MLNTNKIPRNATLKYIYDSFSVPAERMKKIMDDFHLEMEKGLSGKSSSLKMIPTFVDTPCGKERGEFTALDLGGTNLRLLELRLKGKGQILTLAERKFVLRERYTKGSQEAFFDFIAACLKDFTGQKKPNDRGGVNLGFTFSFPIKQTGIASGILLRWTKDFSVKGARNKEVVGLLKSSLARKGLTGITVAALVNDTVGTLIARSYSDPGCDAGVILGTGTNACYREKASRVRKLKKTKGQARHMIINIEWGNFNKLKPTPFDAELDKSSANPGEQILEKMVSGMYLGEIARLVTIDLAKKKILLSAAKAQVLSARGMFKTEYMSRIESDSSNRLLRVDRLLKELGIHNSRLEDRIFIKEICKIVSARGARIAAAVLAGVITKIDSRLSAKHTVAIDGTLYEKHPGYAQNIKSALREILGRKAGNIRLALTKDGSGKGAAIAAAVAVSRKVM